MTLSLRRHLALWLTLSLWVLGCSGDGGDTVAPSADAATLPKEIVEVAAVCTAWAAPRAEATLTADYLQEISGLAVSRQNPGIVWVHNDSGGEARVIAVDTKGQGQVALNLSGVDADDWEDLALGPCGPTTATPDVDCLYVADLGDNALEDSEGVLYRIPEPTVLSAPDSETLLQDFLVPSKYSASRVLWPDGPRDVEALAVLPDGRVLLLTKNSVAASEVWRLSFEPDGGTAIELLGELDTATKDGDYKPVTAADLDPGGQRLVVRTAKKIWLFDLASGLTGDSDSAAVSLATASRQSITPGEDEDGEAMAWDADGGIWHTSEATDDVLPTLWYIGCARRD